MTRMVFRTALMALLGLGSVAGAQSRVLYDSRLPTPEPRLTEMERGRVEYLAEQAARAGAWDGAAGLDYCTGDDFAIAGMVPGSFTAKGAKQVAYLYTYCYARPGDMQGLVILEGLNAVAHYTFVDHYFSMYAVKDINQNGFTELALDGGFTGQGYTEGWLDLLELRPQRRFIAQFNYDNKLQPWLDDCGIHMEGWTSLLLKVTPGPTPKFTAQELKGKCGNERVVLKQGSVRAVTVKPAPTGFTPAPLR